MTIDRIQEGQDLLLANIGLAILECQLVERLLSRCIVFVLPDAPENRQWRPGDKGSAFRTRTLGQLSSILRERYAMSADLDKLVTATVEMRNMLVHRLLDVRGFAFDSEEGLAKGVEVAGHVRHTAQRLRDVLAPLEKTWTDDSRFGAEVRTFSQSSRAAIVSAAEKAGITQREHAPNLPLQPPPARGDSEGGKGTSRAGRG